MRNTLFALAVCTAVTAVAQDKLADGLYARFTTTKGDITSTRETRPAGHTVPLRLSIALAGRGVAWAAAVTRLLAFRVRFRVRFLGLQHTTRSQPGDNSAPSRTHPPYLTELFCRETIIFSP